MNRNICILLLFSIGVLFQSCDEVKDIPYYTPNSPPVSATINNENVSLNPGVEAIENAAILTFSNSNVYLEFGFNELVNGRVDLNEDLAYLYALNFNDFFSNRLHEFNGYIEIHGVNFDGDITLSVDFQLVSPSDTLKIAFQNAVIKGDFTKEFKKDVLFRTKIFEQGPDSSTIFYRSRATAYELNALQFTRIPFIGDASLELVLVNLPNLEAKGTYPLTMDNIHTFYTSNSNAFYLQAGGKIEMHVENVISDKYETRISGHFTGEFEAQNGAYPFNPVLPFEIIDNN